MKILSFIIVSSILLTLMFRIGHLMCSTQAASNNTQQFEISAQILPFQTKNRFFNVDTLNQFIKDKNWVLSIDKFL